MKKRRMQNIIKRVIARQISKLDDTRSPVFVIAVLLRKRWKARLIWLPNILVYPKLY